MKRSHFFLLGAGFIMACSKEETPPPAGWDWFGTHDDHVYNYVLVSANQVTNRQDSSDYQIQVSAAFIDSTTNRLTGVDALTINQRNIYQTSDNTYSFGYDNSPYFDEGLSLFGTNVTIHIKGAEDGDTLNRNVYLPKRVVKLISDFPEKIDLNGDVHLAWDPDPNNVWGNVIVQVYYYPNFSQINDSTLPQAVKPLNYTTPDIGHFTVPRSDLQRFPEKSYVGISIARGGQNIAVLPLSKKRIFFFSSSSASTPPLLVGNAP